MIVLAGILVMGALVLCYRLLNGILASVFVSLVISIGLGFILRDR